eukprot:7358279-Karenia_brevis.AAC.1
MAGWSLQGLGRNSNNVQRDLTTVHERVRFQRLDVALRALPREDMRRAAWTNLDAFSTTWVSCWPSADCRVSNAELVEIAA